MWAEEERRTRRRETRRNAREAVDEARLQEVLKAAGARRVNPEAARALRAVTEEEAARLAEEAVAVAEEREEAQEVQAQHVAVAAARLRQRAREER